MVLLAGRRARARRFRGAQGFRQQPQEHARHAGASAAAVTARPTRTSATVEFQVALKMRDFPKLLARLAKRRTHLPGRDGRALLSARVRRQGRRRLGRHPGADRRWHGRQQPRRAPARHRRAGADGAAHDLSPASPFEGAAFTAAQTTPSLPASVAAPVLGINGLQPYLHAHRHHTAIVRRASVAADRQPRRPITSRKSSTPTTPTTSASPARTRRSPSSSTPSRSTAT